jgi:hypothetical protein
VAAHRDRPAPGLADHGPRLADLLQRSLSKDPSVRPPDAAAFLAELEEAAEERYGAGWRSRASIAGLVASTVGVGAATMAGTVAGGAAPTVVASGLPPVPPAVTGATQAVVSTGRRISTKVVLAAGATAAVVVAAVVVGLTLTSGDDDEDAGPAGAPTSSSSEPTLSEEEIREQERREKIDELESGVLTGTYRVVQKVTSASYIVGGDASPPNEKYTWTFSAPKCKATGCRGKVDSSVQGTGGIRFEWDGRTLTISRAPYVVTRGRCTEPDGTVLPFSESGWKGTYTYDYEPTAVPAGADGLPPKRFSVNRTAKFSKYSLVGTCEWSEGTWTRLVGVLEFTRRK